MISARLVALACALFVAPILLHAQREKLPPDDYDIVMKKWPNAQISNTGIRYIVENPGSGPLVGSGDMISVNYVGALLNGKIFDKQLDPNKPFTFRVGRGLVIDGWDQILQLMRPNAKWLIIVPPELGYGRRGSPPRIPEYATLVFEVEVVSVKREN
jgi:FKBP-type peptidyl-prolyl cis-trans isomerase